MHIDDAAALGRRLEEARLAAGLTQRELAFEGCSATYISRIEAGQRVPSLQILRELARRVGVSEDFLATGVAKPRLDENQKLLDADIAAGLDERELAEQLYREVLESATTDAERAHATAGLGNLAQREGDQHRAIEYLEEAVRLYGPAATNHATVGAMLGKAYAMIGDLPRAIDLLRRWRGDAEERGDQMDVIRFSVYLAQALEDAGEFAEAEAVLEQTAPLVEETHDPLMHVRLHWSRSRLHALENRPWLAANYARKALEILELTENTRYTGFAHQLLAGIENDRRRPEEALELLAKGRTLLADRINEVERAQFRLEEARALAALGRHEEAGQLAMEIAAAIGDADPMDAARAYTLLGDVFRELGERERAREVYELAVELLTKTGGRYLGEAYAKLAELLEEEGETEEALALLKKAVQAPGGVARARRPPRD